MVVQLAPDCEGRVLLSALREVVCDVVGAAEHLLAAIVPVTALTVDRALAGSMELIEVVEVEGDLGLDGLSLLRQ